MSAESLIITPIVKWFFALVGSLLAFAMGLVSYLAKTMHKKIQAHDEEFKLQGREITKLKETLVTEDKARAIVKEEITPIYECIQKIDTKFDQMSDKLNNVIIKAAITSELQKANFHDD